MLEVPTNMPGTTIEYIYTSPAMSNSGGNIISMRNPI